MVQLNPVPVFGAQKKSQYHLTEIFQRNFRTNGKVPLPSSFRAIFLNALSPLSWSLEEPKLNWVEKVGPRYLVILGVFFLRHTTVHLDNKVFWSSDENFVLVYLKFWGRSWGFLSTNKEHNKWSKNQSKNTKVMVVSAFILSHEQELNNSARPDKLTSRLQRANIN